MNRQTGFWALALHMPDHLDAPSEPARRRAEIDSGHCRRAYSPAPASDCTLCWLSTSEGRGWARHRWAGERTRTHPRDRMPIRTKRTYLRDLLPIAGRAGSQLTWAPTANERSELSPRLEHARPALRPVAPKGLRCRPNTAAWRPDAANNGQPLPWAMPSCAASITCYTTRPASVRSGADVPAKSASGNFLPPCNADM